MTTNLDATRLTVWSADSGPDAGTLSLLVWDDDALESGSPSVEIHLTIGEALELVRELHAVIDDAQTAKDYWQAASQAEWASNRTSYPTPPQPPTD